MKDISLENQIIDIWKILLDAENIELNTNFFSLGGDDLLFACLKNEIQKKFNVDTHDLTTELATVYQQVLYIKKCLNISSNQLIIKLQNGQTNPALVFIHPIGGTLFSFMPLIKKLAIDNAIYGIQDCLLTGDMRHFNSLSEQATLYVTELKKLLSNEKLILAGYSSGGSIASEMAHQLTADGIEVQHLIMFDSWAHMPFGIEFRNKFKSIILRQFDKIKPYHFFDTQQKIDYWLNVLWNRMRLLFTYSPKKIAVDTTLFAPIEPVPEYTVDKSAINDWAKFVRNLNVHYVSGNHENMLDEVDVTPISEKFHRILQHNN